MQEITDRDARIRDPRIFISDFSPGAEKGKNSMVLYFHIYMNELFPLSF